MKRKYMSEFGLHTYSSHLTICYPNDLNTLELESSNHIYMVALIPKLSYDPDSLRIFEDHISVKVNIITESSNISRNLEFALIQGNHKELKYNFDKPLKSLSVTNEAGQGVKIRVLSLYIELTRENLDAEIMYIGQAYGKAGERDALDRLKSHSTLQKIQSDVLFEEPMSDIAIILFEFTPKLLASFDGMTKDYEKSSEEDQKHLINIMAQPPLELNNQMINITEAALIHYFKPEYNEKFKNNFPKVEHLGYKHYYDMDYNALLVELDMDAIKINLFSKEKKYIRFEAIKYTLHPENVRKDMFDIFGKEKRDV
ncbi:hypothetical protein COJ41_09375 [Bacillus thuringiensis]|uniref:hypothetical protein n=1 Tax=Bacillus thuringiensis TaxID=1428 RepID=UPI000BF6F156|nr:hypothetical protein [Bacillus thuringiensis]PFM23835.1 hypothetical protein COJ41_09375 [Bacillus thuringiensis]